MCVVGGGLQLCSLEVLPAEHPDAPDNHFALIPPVSPNIRGSISTLAMEGPTWGNFLPQALQQPEPSPLAT